MISDCLGLDAGTGALHCPGTLDALDFFNKVAKKRRLGRFLGSSLEPMISMPTPSVRRRKTTVLDYKHWLRLSGVASDCTSKEVPLDCFHAWFA